MTLEGPFQSKFILLFFISRMHRAILIMKLHAGSALLEGKNWHTH